MVSQDQPRCEMCGAELKPDEGKGCKACSAKVPRDLKAAREGAGQPRDKSPLWEGFAIDSPRTLLRLVGGQGVERLAGNRARDLMDAAMQVLAPKIGQRAANELDDYVSNVVLEITEVSLLLGSALATSGMLHGDCEQWLAAAIKAAGLGGYNSGLTLDVGGEEARDA